MCTAVLRYIIPWAFSLAITGALFILIGSLQDLTHVHASANKINLQSQALQPVTNSAVFATHDQIHAGESRCISGNQTIAYTCSFGPLNKALLAYTYGMTLLLVPDVDCTVTQNCSINIDNVGIKTLKATDGTTGVALTHLHGYLFFYDINGVFRLVG